MMPRRVVRVVAAFLAAWLFGPWLALGSAGAVVPASAYVEGGIEWHPFRVDFPAVISIRDVPLPSPGSCTGTYGGVWGIHGDGSGTLAFSADCTGWVDPVPGTTPMLAAGRTYEVELWNSAGGTCGTDDGTFTERGGGHWWEPTRSSMDSALSWGGDCGVPTDVCIFLEGSTSETPGCFAVELPEQVLLESECEYGTPQSVTLEASSDVQRFWTDWTFEIRVDGLPVGNGMTGAQAEGWNFGYWEKEPRVLGGGLAWPHATDVNGWPDGNSTSMWRHKTVRVSHLDDEWIEGPRPDVTLAGVEIYYLTDEPRGVEDWNRGYSNGASYYASPLATQVPTKWNMPFGGLTDPAHCRFWVGEKVVNLTDTEIDEPFGEVVDEGSSVSVEPPGLPPIDEPPGESNWWAALWGILKSMLAVMRSIVGAILSLPAKIADAIIDGIADLFVPSDGYGESAAEDVRDAFADTKPGAVADALGTLTVQGVDGCEGLSLNLSLPGGVTIDEQVGAACSGKSAEAAGLVRSVVAAALVIGGGFTGLRLLGAGLGWVPDAGRRAA